MTAALDQTPTVNADPGDGYGEYVEIPLTRGYAAWVSPEDYATVGRFKWTAHVVQRRGRPHVRAHRRTPTNEDGHRGMQYMHRLILPAEFVDHRNGNPLDNRRANLRPTTYSENASNVRRGGTSEFNGVHWSHRLQAWVAKVRVPRSGRPVAPDWKGRSIHLGTFPRELDAAMAYDSAALLIYGEVPRPNVPGVGDRPPLSDRARSLIAAALDGTR